MRFFYFASLTGFIFALHGISDPKENAELKTELLRTVPRCDEIAENAARLILGGKPAEAVLIEWKSVCPANTQVTLYELALALAKVDETTKELTPELWTYLKVTRSRRRERENHPEYRKLLKKTAQEQTATSEDGKALQNYFLHGYYSFHASVAGARGGRLWEFYRAEEKAAREGFFMSLAMSAGAWVPTGNLARMGNHPALGFQFMGGYGRFSAGILMDFRFVNTPSAYAYYDPNTQSIRQTTTFFSLFFGPDFRWELVQDEQFSVFLLASLGYDMISHYAAPRYSGKAPVYSDSFNVNGGLAFRYYFSVDRTLYLDGEIRYHRARYSSGASGGDDLSGDYVTTNAAIGYRIAFY